MAKTTTIRKCFCAALIALLLLVGIAVSGVVRSTATPAFSQAPEPKCVCAECGRTCGSGHAKGCSSAPTK